MFDLAIYYRMVGGFSGLGSTTLARLRWSFCIALYMTFVSMVHHQSAVSWLVIFVGTFIAGYAGRLVSHSRFQSVASVGNAIGMSVVELIRMALILVPYYFVGLLTGDDFVFERVFVLVLAVGAGAAYYIGNKYLDGKDCGIYYRNTFQQYYVSILPVGISADPNPATKLDRCAVGGTEWGELLTGLLCYQAMYMALLVLP